MVQLSSQPPGFTKDIRGGGQVSLPGVMTAQRNQCEDSEEQIRFIQLGQRRLSKLARMSFITRGGEPGSDCQKPSIAEAFLITIKRSNDLRNIVLCSIDLNRH